MQKLDRLGWAAGMSVTSYGVRIGVRTNEPEALPSLLDRLPPGWQPATSPVVERLYSLVVGGPGSRPNIRRFNLLYADHLRLARAAELDPLLDTFESDVQLSVAEVAPDRLFVHAGVVGWQGRAILIPGRSFSGKTTLVAELVRAGATYYSDEYAVLDRRGWVHPYPRPLTIREPGTPKPAKWPVEALGGTVGEAPLPVGLVAVSTYRAGARWRPRRLSPGQGALALLANTVSARRQPAVMLAMLQRVMAQALALKSQRGEAQEVVSSLFRALDDRGWATGPPAK